MRAFLADLTASPAGLWRLAVGRDDWRLSFAGDLPGFWRSFLALIPALLFALAADAPLRQAVGAPPGGVGVVYATLLSFAAYSLLYPAFVALLTSRFGGAAGFPAFVLAFNWMRFWLNAAYAAIGLAASAGLPAPFVAGAWTLFAGLSLYLIWRAARETLTGEISLSVAVVLLALASQVASDYVAGALLSGMG